MKQFKARYSITVSRFTDYSRRSTDTVSGNTTIDEGEIVITVDDAVVTNSVEQSYSFAAALRDSIAGWYMSSGYNVVIVEIKKIERVGYRSIWRIVSNLLYEFKRLGN